MTYEYVCGACRHEWEASQSINDKPLTSCPKCKKKTAKRQISGGTGFLLKGGGWYADGYASTPPASDSSKTESAGDAKSDKSKTSGDSSATKTSSSKSSSGKPKSSSSSD